MRGRKKAKFIERLEKPEEIVAREEVIEFIEELWEDYAGAYNEGKVDGMERTLELLKGGL